MQEETQNISAPEDHDFIPDERQEQTPLPQQQGAPQIPQMSKEPEPEEVPQEERAEKPPKPEKRGWQPIDLSHGKITKGIFGSRRAFEANVRNDLKKGLGSILNASQRQDIADTLANKRSRGLRPWEVKQELDKKVKEGKLTKFEAKRLKCVLKIKKPSSIF
ncbi:MAG: hypothetical protein HY396_02050 [Candidatus Doudnabacteria bacterium]|nr:hypothetical protein [Candidatus Doudnabacteria bacterium]